jgi:hypothetical protein
VLPFKEEKVSLNNRMGEVKLRDVGYKITSGVL